MSGNPHKKPKMDRLSKALGEFFQKHPPHKVVVIQRLLNKYGSLETFQERLCKQEELITLYDTCTGLMEVKEVGVLIKFLMSYGGQELLQEPEQEPEPVEQYCIGKGPLKTAFFFICSLHPQKIMVDLPQLFLMSEISRRKLCTLLPNLPQSIDHFEQVQSYDDCVVYIAIFGHTTSASMNKEIVCITERDLWTLKDLPKKGIDCSSFFHKKRETLQFHQKYKELQKLLSKEGNNADVHVRNLVEELQASFCVIPQDVEFISEDERTSAFYNQLVKDQVFGNISSWSLTTTFTNPCATVCCPYTGGADIVLCAPKHIVTVKVVEEVSENYKHQVFAEGVMFAARLLYSSFKNNVITHPREVNAVSSYSVLLPVGGMLKVWKFTLDFTNNVVLKIEKGQFPLNEDFLGVVLKHLIDKLEGAETNK